MALLLTLGGAAAGAAWSQFTTDALVWRPVPSQVPMTDAPVAAPVDQVQAGQSWARSAFDGGLRKCPAVNAEFLAACESEMKALAARPALPLGSYGGPLLVTKVEPVARDPEIASYRPEQPAFDNVRDEPDTPGYEDEEDGPAFGTPLEATPDDYPAAPRGE